MSLAPHQCVVIKDDPKTYQCTVCLQTGTPYPPPDPCPGPSGDSPYHEPH